MSDKPCPFCGFDGPDSPEIFRRKSDMPLALYARCNSCGARGPEGITHSVAFGLWNRRLHTIDKSPPTPGDRPATEIEVTPEMIEAADRALFEAGIQLREGDSTTEAAEVIYRAMETARLGLSVCARSTASAPATN